MNITFRGIGYTPNDEDRAFLDKKLQKIAFAEDYLHDLDIAVKKEAKGIGFHLDAVLHFVWRKEKVVSEDCYELYEGIEKLADKIQSAAKKEKEIVKDNRLIILEGLERSPFIMMAPIISENPSKVFGTVQPPSSRLQAKFSLVISIRKKVQSFYYPPS